MGDDGFNHTQNYCEQNQNVTFKSPTLDYPLHLLKGNDEWIAYNFNINILSDTNFGDLNFNQSINISDIDDEAKKFPIVTKVETNVTLNSIMSNSFGFGGTNATLVFEKLN